MPTSTRKPSPYERAGSAEINATVERVAPAILELLADGVPRTKAAMSRRGRPARQAGRGARADPPRGDRPGGGDGGKYALDGL